MALAAGTWVTSLWIEEKAGASNQQHECRSKFKNKKFRKEKSIIKGLVQGK